MRKKWIDRAMSAGLALILIMSGLTACGSNGFDTEKSALAKENVYSFQEIGLPDIGGDYSNILSTFKADSRIYVLIQEDYYTENYDTEYHLISFNEDGTDPLDVELVVNETAAGELSDADEPTAVDEDESNVIPSEEGSVDGESFPENRFGDNYNDFWENNALSNLSYGGNALYGIRNYNCSSYSTDYNVNYYYICSWNLDGTIRWESELEDFQSQNIQALAVAPDGSLCMIISDNEQYILNVSSDGEIGEKRTVSKDVREILSSCQFMQSMENGHFIVIFYRNNDMIHQYITEYDPITDTMIEPTEIPGTVLYGYNSMNVGKESDLIYSTSSGLYLYNIGDKTGTMMMDFINSDLYINDFRNVIELDETHFVGLFYDNMDNTLKGGLFTYTPPEDIADKRVMVLGGIWISDDVKQRVVEFNRSSQNYRITIKDYTEYTTLEDYQAGLTQLNNDIISGNMPDILIANASLPMNNYVAKGVLADINDLIEGDEELSKKEFLQNVFDAYSVDGDLYYVIPNFTVSTMIGKSSVVGDRTSWTMEDMLQLAETLPEGTTMIDGLSRPYFFYTVMQFCGNDFIDIDTGKCDFDTEAFMDMMEYAKTLPEYFTYDEDYWMNYGSRYREDRTILMSAFISSFSNLSNTINGYFGENVSFIGFPTASGKGAFLTYGEAYCIADKSPNKNGAWEFLRYYLTDEYQRSDFYYLPVQKDVFEEKSLEALERPYRLNSDGEKEYYDEYFSMNGEEFLIEPLNKEQLDAVVDYIYSIDNAYYYNSDIVNIIDEETGAFYEGQKTAQEVADTIQRRVQIYVDENR